MNAVDFAYDAFLSYSHADGRAARRVQRYLERYRLPGGRARLRIFRDDTDLRAGSLPSELEEALARSRALIVCCSPAAADARWVDQEIETFRAQNAERPVLLLLIAGSIENVVPPALRGSEPRYSDLRHAWWLGWMRPRAQIELVRALAALARLELRDLIPWDRRRRRRNALAAATFASFALAGTALFPFQASRVLPLPQAAGGLRALEFCDVIDGRLMLTARERSEGPQGGRNYVAFFADALGPEADSWQWLDDYNVEFVPSHRLSHSGSVWPDWLRRAASALPMDSLQRLASAAAAERAAVLEEERGEQRRFLRGGFWAGEPSPGLYVGLFAISPLPQFPGDEFEPPHRGDAVVGVGRAGAPARIAVIEGLYPREPSEQPYDRRSANLNDGLPVAMLGNTLWIGMPVREDGGVGGLWRSDDGGGTWQRDEVTGTVASLLADTANGRVLLATAAGRWDGGARDGVYDTELRQWSPGAAEWTSLDGPPFSTNSDVQFCGMMDARTRVTRVDRQIFATGRQNLLRQILGR